MIRRYFLPLLGVVGVGGALTLVVIGNRQPPESETVVVPAGSPFASFVAGAGRVEASTGNISIGSPVSGVVEELNVHVGDRVAAGDPLFKIDDRDLRAQLITANARVEAARATVEQPRHHLETSENLGRLDAGAISAENLADLRDQLAIAQANLALANAQVAQLNSEISRHTVRAPVAGRVLQLNLRVGEYVNGGAIPPLVFGDDSMLFVRIDIDESDAWRVKPDAKAMAFLRGNPQIGIVLQYEYIEPYIVPKTSLTGRSTERADTRVLQVIYSFPRADWPVYIGQQLDVFIEAPVVATSESQSSL